MVAHGVVNIPSRDKDDGRGPAGAEVGIANAEELRGVLRLVELALANVRGIGPQATLEMLRRFDAIEEAIPRLEAEYGVDLKPERTRLETAENMLRSRASMVVREAGPENIAAARDEVRPSGDEWWWFLDRLVAERRRETIRRWSMRGAIALGVLLLVGVAYQLFLAPPKAQQAASEHISNGELDIQRGDLQAALTEYEAALQINPNDVENQLYVAALLQQLGRTDEAAPHFATAQRLSPSAADYHASLSLVYYKMAVSGANTVNLAEAEANAAVKADDKSAMAHFALASVYELQGKVPEAIQEFETASNLSKDPRLTVLARMRMGMLMQRPDQGVGMPSSGVGGAP